MTDTIPIRKGRPGWTAAISVRRAGRGVSGFPRDLQRESRGAPRNVRRPRPPVRRSRLGSEGVEPKAAGEPRRAEELASRLDGILRCVPVGVVAVDPDGRIIEFNRAAEKITGYAKEMVVGFPMEI